MFYLINGSEPDVSLTLRITTLFYKMAEEPPIERAILFHLKAYKEMAELENEQRLIVSLMLFNYSLVKSGIPTVMLQPFHYPQYIEARDAYFTKGDNSIFAYLANTVLTSKTQDKSYYKNLTPITVSEICKNV